MLWALQVALVERWKTDADLVAFLGGEHVYDGVAPPEAGARYITLGEDSEAGVNTLGTRGYRNSAYAHGWTRGYNGKRDVKELARLMDAAVHKAPLLLDGFGTVFVENELTVIVPDPDPLLRHAALRYAAEAMGAE